ncbi:MAG: hypothetical protein MJ016_02365 [Victivallaceae bacterium]|nr:hypothetical protein [Victivallaceae bacterium]
MMDEMRFGAILFSENGKAGFYVSHRVVLSVSDAGVPHAFAFEKFGECRVFVRNYAAVAFPEAMLGILNADRIFPDSVAMIAAALKADNVKTLAELEDFMHSEYGAVPEKFIVREVAGSSENDDALRKMDDFDPEKELNEKFAEARRKFGKRPNVLICGYTGVGKTSLVKAILGDIVPDNAIGFGKPTTQGFACYENDVIRVWDSKGLESGQTESEFRDAVRDFVRDRQSDPDVDNHIHLVWYAIQAPGARVTDCDLALIRNVFNRRGVFAGDDVIVVITKSEYLEADEKARFIQILTDAGVPEERIVFTSTRGGKPGCRDLVAASWKLLPEAYKDAFISAQRIDEKAKINAVYAKSGAAKTIIAGAVAAAAAAGAISLPLSDAAILVPMQIGMIASLAGLYGLNKEAVKMSMTPFVLKIIGVFTASSLLKIIPALGNAVNASVAGSITGALGVYVKKHFEECAVARIEKRPEPEFVFNMSLFKVAYAEYLKNPLKK